MSVVVSIRVSRRVLDVVEEMIRRGMASSRNEALNILIARGIEVVQRELARRRRVEELVRMFEREGGITLPLETNAAEEVGRDRERWTT